MTADEARQVLEVFWNEDGYICYTVQPKARFFQKYNLKKWCCGRPMRVFEISTMPSSADGHQNVYVCLLCTSCAYKGGPKREPGYLRSLQEEQRLKQEFPERYREYKEYRVEFAAEGVCLSHPLTFKEFFFGETPRLKTSVRSLLENVRKHKRT